MIGAFHRLAGRRIEPLERRDHAVCQTDAQRLIFRIRRVNLNSVAISAISAALQLMLGPIILQARQAAEKLFLSQPRALGQRNLERAIIVGIAHAVDRRYRGDDDRIAALDQRFCRRQAQPFQMLVDRGILRNELIAARQIHFRLEIVVIGDEILHGVFREKSPHLVIELRCQRLVGGKDQGGALQTMDDVRHREGLARARDALEGLVMCPLFDAGDQARDRFGLIACRRVLRVQYENIGRHWKSSCRFRPRRALDARRR